MKKDKLPGFVVLLILTAITSVFWIMFSVYRSFSKPTPTTVPPEILEPINPVLDTQTVETLKNKIYP